MTKEERRTYYDSGTFQRSVGMELLDWAGYWTSAGMLDAITDPIQKKQMMWAIQVILTDLSYATKIVSALAMSYSDIKNAVVPTELNIQSVVTNIMTYKLEWITNIHEEPASEEPEE